MTPYRLTRFAPAPTGLLHLGHAVNAIHVWGLGVRLGARVLLRIEDHDAQRSRAEFERALLDDLDWLGFVPDVHPTDTFRAGTCVSRQRDRDAVYKAAAQTLMARGLIYGCTCTRQDLVRHHASRGSTSTAYPNTCRARNLAPVDGTTWRVRVEPGTESFLDLLAGAHVHDPAGSVGDVAIRDRYGNWTYTFAVVVDDMDQAIDLVIRGRDLLDATGMQLRLARMLGRHTPLRFAHHPIVMKTPTQKLSKADGDTGLRKLRDDGWTPERVLGHAAWIAGLTPESRPLRARDVAVLFADRQFESPWGSNESPIQK